MIEGLKVSVSGSELQQLCANRAEHHKKRVAAYAEQLASLENAKVEGMGYSGGDPVKSLRDKLEEHHREGEEIQWIGQHLKPEEEYQLGRDDLLRLGIVKNRY